MKKLFIWRVFVAVLFIFIVVINTVMAENNDSKSVLNNQDDILTEPETITVDVLLQRAQDYKAVNDFAGMIEVSTRAIELDKKSVAAYMQRGICYAELGMNDLALSDFAVCIAIQPTYVDAYIEEAVVLTAQGHYVEALQELKDAALIDVPNTADYNNIKESSPQANNKDNQKNISQLLTYDILQSDSQNARLYNSLGVVCFKTRDYKNALLAYNKAIAIDGKYADAYNNRGVLEYTQKNYMTALDDFSCAIENNAQDAKAYNNRGLTKKKLKDYRGAIADYEYAIKLDARYTDALFNLASLCESLGEYEKAQVAYGDYLRYADNSNLDRVSYVQKRVFALQVKERKAKSIIKEDTQNSM